LTFIFRGIWGITAFTRGIGKGVLLFIAGIANYAQLIVSICGRVHLVVKNPAITVNHMYTLGIESLALVTVIALFTGSVTVTQAVYQMSGLVPMRYLGVLVCKGITTELGPVITSMVVAGRVATGIAAEIGSMKASEQLDAMHVLKLDPIRYLIVPKFVACIVMLPILVIWAEFVAFFGAAATVFFTVDMTMYTFLNGLRLFFSAGDLFVGIAKTMVFGAIIAVSGSHFGLEVKGGAAGIGDATTKAVVMAAVLILIFDFLIAVLAL